MQDPRDYHFALPPWYGPAPDEPPAEPYPGVDAVLPYCTSSRDEHYDGIIRAIVIHATAEPNSEISMGAMFSHRASFHWLVPGPREAEHGRFSWRCVPENLAAWHVRNSRSHPELWNGHRFVNSWSIGIEVVNIQDGVEPFTEWQVEQTAALVRSAWSRHPQIHDVISHARLDPERRTDPGPQFPWDRFRDLVLARDEEEIANA
ncbi:MAG: N-acetylmuramoyl-L-alanine amidase [Thermoanaerobaculia bacterium]